MFRNGFGKRKGTDVSYFEPLLKVLTAGTAEELLPWLYAHHTLAEVDRLSLLQALHKFCPQSFSAEANFENNQSLQIVSHYPAGRFLLLVLHVPWEQQAPNQYCPLLLKQHKQQWFLVGFSQPWVALLEQFSNAELDDLQTLSATWIQYRLSQLSSEK
jgi:hypothetical protein